jgi:hypothetical protein
MPQLTVLEREVRLGNGYADLLAVESTGRLVVIEVKLSANVEPTRTSPRSTGSRNEEAPGQGHQVPWKPPGML